MKPARLLTTLLLLFITTTIFAQKVHYKDRYYTIVKSKIFHRGHDVYGRLSPGKIDTIYIIAKELYTEDGKLKEKYKKRKKRDRYKLPNVFWQERSLAAAATENTNLVTTTETTVAPSNPENASNVSAALAVQTIGTAVKEKEQIEEKEPKVVNNKEANKVKTTNNSPQKVSTVKGQKKVEKEKKQQKTTAQKDKPERKSSSLQPKQGDKKHIEGTATKKTKNNKSKQDNGSESKKENSITKEYNQAKKSNEKRTKEAKNIESKKRELAKEKKVQSKKQKTLNATAAILTSTSVVSSSLSEKEIFGTIYFKINKEKTSATIGGDILLFFDVINNSNKDLVILKPNNSMDIRLDFFSNTMECEDIPIKSTDYLATKHKINDDDYLTIPANTKIELFVNGRYRNWLACSSEDVVLQIRYNPFKTSEEGVALQPPFKNDLNKSLKRITPIKIESENIKFKLKKQE